MKRFHTISAVFQRQNLKSCKQKSYFKPLTSPLSPIGNNPDGSPILPVPRNHPNVIIPSPIPDPTFPMSDGSGPTPTPSMTNQEMKHRTGLIGVKLGMTHMWDEFGARKPVTVVQIKDNQVVTTRFHNTKWRTQIAADNFEKLHKVNRAMLFVYRRYRIQPKKVMEEFPVSPDACIPSGFSLNAAHFVPGQFVDTQGISRGHGFQGVMKRWGFGGGSKTHGNSKNHRTGGSIGQSTTPAKVHKGKKMPGNMGNKTCTVKNLRVMKIDPHENLLYLAGSIPGAAGSYVNVKDANFKMTQKKCFPEGAEIPYPTFLKDPTQLPREMMPAAPTAKQLEQDPFLRQRSEATS